MTVEADSSMIRALLECDSLGQVRMRELVEYRAGNRMAPPKIIIRDNVLTAEAKVDSTAIFLQLKDRYEQHIGTTDTVIVETVEVNRLTWWQRLWIRTGQTLAGALAACVVFIVIKRKIL